MITGARPSQRTLEIGAVAVVVGTGTSERRMRGSGWMLRRASPRQWRETRDGGQAVGLVASRMHDAPSRPRRRHIEGRIIARRIEGEVCTGEE